MVSLSAPVCFCAKVHWRSRPFCVVDEVMQELRPLDAGLDLEVALFGVEAEHAVVMRRMSISRPSSRNCWPPMAWRAPQMRPRSLPSAPP